MYLLLGNASVELARAANWTPLLASFICSFFGGHRSSAFLATISVSAILDSLSLLVTEHDKNEPIQLIPAFFADTSRWADQAASLTAFLVKVD
jgi:hypothetical protein